MEPTAVRAEALEFLKANKTGVLATLSKENTPRARLVYYVADESFNLYFVTLLNTRKAEDIAAHSAVAFAVNDTSIPKTLQLEGIAENVTDAVTEDPVLGELAEVLFSNAPYYAPLNRFDSGVVAVFRITPTWIRWGKFTTGTGNTEIFTELT